MNNRSNLFNSFYINCQLKQNPKRISVLQLKFFFYIFINIFLKFIVNDNFEIKGT